MKREIGRKLGGCNYDLTSSENHWSAVLVRAADLQAKMQTIDESIV